MSDQSDEFVTVYRSAGDSAEADAVAVHELLKEGGLDADLFGSDEPGVIEGTFEVRVPVAQAPAAEQLIAENEEPSQESDAVNPSHDLDLVPVFSSTAVNAESEAIAILGILEANGIYAVLMKSTPYPNLPFAVQVERKDLERAENAIAEAKAAGPAAAEEAEEASEGTV